MMQVQMQRRSSCQLLATRLTPTTNMKNKHELDGGNCSRVSFKLLYIVVSVVDYTFTFTKKNDNTFCFCEHICDKTMIHGQLRTHRELGLDLQSSMHLQSITHKVYHLNCQTYVRLVISEQPSTEEECLHTLRGSKLRCYFGSMINDVLSMSLLNQFRYKPEQEPKLLLREGLMLCSVRTSTTPAKVWFTETSNSI